MQIWRLFTDLLVLMIQENQRIFEEVDRELEKERDAQFQMAIQIGAQQLEAETRKGEAVEKLVVLEEQKMGQKEYMSSLLVHEDGKQIAERVQNEPIYMVKPAKKGKKD